jgi:hypothetical protein
MYHVYLIWTSYDDNQYACIHTIYPILVSYILWRGSFLHNLMQEPIVLSKSSSSVICLARCSGLQVYMQYKHNTSIYAI